jgi:hypothetical protein
MPPAYKRLEADLATAFNACPTDLAASSPALTACLAAFCAWLPASLASLRRRVAAAFLAAAERWALVCWAIVTSPYSRFAVFNPHTLSEARININHEIEALRLYRRRQPFGRHLQPFRA